MMVPGTTTAKCTAKGLFCSLMGVLTKEASVSTILSMDVPYCFANGMLAIANDMMNGFGVLSDPNSQTVFEGEFKGDLTARYLHMQDK